MNLHLVFPKLPPAHDAIGDYTAQLSATLAAEADVQILTAAPADELTPIPGVDVQSVFSIDERSGVRGLAGAKLKPGWLVVQYNPFSYGNWGYNPHLLAALKKLKHRYPLTRLAMMVHETAPPPIRWQMALMNVWQRPQLWRLGRLADLVFFSIEPWMQTYGRRFPQTPVVHLPVASNIPNVGMSYDEARQRLGIAKDTFVVGIFGTTHHSRLLHMITAATQALYAKQPKLQVMYVGPHGDDIKANLAGIPVHDAGRLPGEGVSEHFAAMDLYLSPFRKGVSTRRGSFMVAIQHGIPSVSTWGSHTGPLLRGQDGEAFLLAAEEDVEGYVQQALALLDDAEMRRRMYQNARTLYTACFSWNAIARKMMDTLQAHDAEHQRPVAEAENA